MSAALGNLSKLNCARLHDISVLFTCLLVNSFTRLLKNYIGGHLCKMQKKLFYKKMQRKEQKKRENGHEKGELYAILL